MAGSIAIGTAVNNGIADALGVNDKRFLPSMSFAAPEKPGRLVITIELG